MNRRNMTTCLAAAAIAAVPVTAGELMQSDASLRIFAVANPDSPDRGDTVTVTFFADITGGVAPGDIATRVPLSYDFSVDFTGLDYVGGSLADASGGIFGAPALGLGAQTLRAVGVVAGGGQVGTWPADGQALFRAQFSIDAGLADGTYEIAPRNNTLAESITMVLIPADFLDPFLLFDNDLQIGVPNPLIGDEFGSTAVTFVPASFTLTTGCNLADVAAEFGVLNVNDIIEFVNGFNAGQPIADVSPAGGDGLLNVNDIIDFVNSFNAGCPASVIFSEDFESLVLGPNVDETLPGTEVFTNVPPAGWTIDNSNTPAGGVTEFRGWTFLDRDWWATTAGNQGRAEFTNAIGACAVADGDEWRDLPTDPASGIMNTLLASPAIDISAQPASALTLEFDYSWRPEGAQEALVEVRYDGGPWQNVFSLTTANSADTTNGSASINLANPAAGTVEFRFGYLNAGNNWWFAVDNIELLGN